MRIRLLAVVALALGVLVAPVPASATTATISPAKVSAHLVKRAGGFVNPVAVTTARDGLTRAFVTE
jgi:hypothetical protein